MTMALAMGRTLVMPPEQVRPGKCRSFCELVLHSNILVSRMLSQGMYLLHKVGFALDTVMNE